MFPGRPWDCGKTFEKVFRLLHPPPLPFLSALPRLASGVTPFLWTVSDETIDRCQLIPVSCKPVAPENGKFTSHELRYLSLT